MQSYYLQRTLRSLPTPKTGVGAFVQSCIVQIITIAYLLIEVCTTRQTKTPCTKKRCPGCFITDASNEKSPQQLLFPTLTSSGTCIRVTVYTFHIPVPCRRNRGGVARAQTACNKISSYKQIRKEFNSRLRYTYTCVPCTNTSNSTHVHKACPTGDVQHQHDLENFGFKRYVDAPLQMTSGIMELARYTGPREEHNGGGTSTLVRPLLLQG